MDICIIFSNALDNAIEACEKISDNPYIFLGIKKFSLYARASKLPNQQITVLHKIHNILKSQTL
ncbi:GHKL domain-containing protein [Roseburia sp. 1XD42-69]|uniref:GHKL domain-containing protein n=1 Tax=Roseburia sp. 1XD42-69 TaxID=2320088 RepID=UPI003FA75A60